MTWAEDQMVEGYLDGRNPDNPEPSTNRSLSYCHGFQSGRDDLTKKPSAPFDVRIKQAEKCLRLDSGTAYDKL